jgi:hypothetical protein
MSQKNLSTAMLKELRPVWMNEHLAHSSISSQFTNRVPLKGHLVASYPLVARACELTSVLNNHAGTRGSKAIGRQQFGTLLPLGG